MRHLPEGQRGMVWIGMVLEAGLAGVAWGLGWLFGQPPFEHFHWNSRDAALGAAASLPLLGVFLLLLDRPWEPLARIRQVIDTVLRPLLKAFSLPELALLALCAGVGEEALFRGLLQALLGRWLAAWAALLVASLLFGLLHPLTAGYIVLATLFGVYLGGLWLATGNLLSVIVAHALYDFLVLVYLVRKP